MKAPRCLRNKKNDLTLKKRKYLEILLTAALAGLKYLVKKRKYLEILLTEALSWI